MHAAAAAPVLGGAVDADVLRQRWPDVLDAVREKRKVAWMLLNSASVESLEGGVLTVAFPKEGEARGFATSGHDHVLTTVLSAMLGLGVRVRAVVGSGATGPGPRGPSRRATADVPAAGTGGGGAGPVGPAGGPGTPSAPAASAAGPGISAGPGTAPGARDTSQEEPEPATGGPGGPSGPDGGPAATAAAAPQPPQSPAPGARNPADGAPSRRGAEPAPGAALDEEEWPDDAGPAGDVAGPTGMELIERQLGGRVIEELEEP